MSAPQRVRAPHFTWVTEVATGDEHAITDSDYDHAMATNAGTYLALCGDDVLPAPMVQAPNGRCRACMGFVAARLSLRSEDERGIGATQQASRTARLLRRLAHPRHAA